MKYEMLISPHRASLILGVSTACLRLWDIQGKIIATRTLGGHRRYYLDSIMAIAPEGTIPKSSDF
jgi:putative resolvase